jgi:hypothetical protein
MSSQSFGQLGTPQDGDALRHNLNIAIKEAQQVIFSLESFLGPF